MFEFFFIMFGCIKIVWNDMFVFLYVLVFIESNDY